LGDEHVGQHSKSSSEWIQSEGARKVGAEDGDVAGLDGADDGRLVGSDEVGEDGF
jgi:predicted transcriptional regulator